MNIVHYVGVMGTEDDPPNELGRGTMTASNWKHTFDTAETDSLQSNEAADDQIDNHGDNGALHDGDGDDHPDGGAAYDALFGGLDDNTYFSFPWENNTDDGPGDRDVLSGSQGGNELFSGYSDGENEITEGAGTDIIDFDDGNGILVGEDAGGYALVEDAFVFDFGGDHDDVADIDARIDTNGFSNAGAFDLLGLSTGTNGSIDQSDAETVITDGANETIIPEYVHASNLGADDFWF